ncbi:hypothetical protein IKG20_03125 [Candidatus Saccharibacteria bacterium]|nr:hypothetical protein [Candidatus Saccharibacteria bacterium]
MAEKEEKSSKKPEKTETKTKSPKKSNKGLLFGIIGGVLVLAAAIAAFVLIKPGAKPDDPKAKLSYSSSFFISDNGKYTLWNAEGKRVTPEEYDYKSEFIAGYAYVRKDELPGVIREDGTVSIPFGKYGSIVADGGLYLARDGNTKEYYLLTSTGRELLHGPELNIYSNSVSSAFAYIETPTEYLLYTYTGDRLASFERAEDIDEPQLSNESDFGALYYNGHNVIFDARTSKVLATIDGPRYTFSDVSDNRAKILLKNSDEDGQYKLLADGRIYDLNETKYYAFTTLDDLIGYDDNSTVAILDNEYKVAVQINDYLALKDYKNYATMNDDGDKAEIVYQGNVVKTFENDVDIESGVLYEDLYAIKSDGNWKFYRLNGDVAFNHEFKDVYSLYDEFHHAVVADEEDEYYLIDSAGNRIGEVTFERLYQEKGGYEVKNSDNKYAIMNEAGEPVTDFKYESLYYRSSAVDRNIWTGRNGTNDYDVIDAKNKRVLLEHVNVISFNTHYFTVKNAEGKTEYYTYDGLNFYTIEG